MSKQTQYEDGYWDRLREEIKRMRMEADADFAEKLAAAPQGPRKAKAKKPRKPHASGSMVRSGVSPSKPKYPSKINWLTPDELRAWLKEPTDWSST